MFWSRLWPWRWLRQQAKRAPARRTPSTARLAVENLEERLVPSTTTFDQAAYQQWRSQNYSIGDLSGGSLIQLDDPVQVVTQTDVSSQATQNNASFGSQIGLPSVFDNTTYRGTGYSVAVIDTGIDYTHADLGGGFGAGYRVIAGWDFANNDANPMDDNGHGTHVAGIIGSSSATYSGVAPNVNLIALKVLDATGAGSFGKVEDALRWVINNQSRYNIVAVNLSLGAGNYTSNPYTFLDDEFTSLRNQGVFIAAAAGNSFYSNNSQVGLGYPAISPLVASVGAVYSGNFGSLAWSSGARDYTTAADRVASFSQRGTALDIMAPGAVITSTYLGNTYRGMAGTSMATPVIAGAAAIIHQAMDARGLTANQDTILNLMRQTGVNVNDGDDENDNVTNTGLTFKRLNLAAALNGLGPVNQAPVLQPISNRQLTPGQSVTVTLSATDAENNALTYSARVVTSLSAQAYALDQQLQLRYSGTGNDNARGLNEKWLTNSASQWYCILPNGELRRWAMKNDEMLQASNLVATLDSAFWSNPDLLGNATAPTSSATPTVTLVGNQLTIQTTSAMSDGWWIEASVNDGTTTTTQQFLVSVRNRAPVLDAISNRHMTPGQSVTVALNATDADGNALTYSARIVSSLSAQAYALDQQLQLRYSGTGNDNARNLNEKWFTNSAGQWFCILPNGELRHWAATNDEMLRAPNLVATLDGAFWATPDLLGNASAPYAGSTPALTMAGNQLTIQTTSAMADGWWIEASVSDGKTSTTQRFLVTVRNRAPVLDAISNRQVTPGQSVSISLSASDAENDAISYSARVVTSLSAQAYALDQQLQLRYSGTGNDNARNLNEKWFTNSASQWYCILPNGELRRWAVKNDEMLQASNLVATLDGAFWANPDLLGNAQAPSSAVPSLSLVANQFTIQTLANVSDGYWIEVTATDGHASSKQLFRVTARSNTAPTIAPIASPTIASGTSQTIVINATDAQGDSLTYQASIVGSFATPPATLVMNGNQLTINTAAGFTGSFDVRVTVSDGRLSSQQTFRVTVTGANTSAALQGDFNGDGLQDSATFEQDGSWWLNLARQGTTPLRQKWAQWSSPSNWKSVHAGDFNGDRKTDLLGFDAQGRLWVAVSNGSSFSLTMWAQWSSPSNWTSLGIGDVNHDGKFDVVGQHKNGTYYVGYSTGAGFTTQAWASSTPPSGVTLKPLKA